MQDLQEPCKPPNKIIAILKYRGREDLASLLRGSYYIINESDSYGHYLFSISSTIEIYTSLPIYEELNALPETDKNIILKAFLDLYPPKAYSIDINSIEFFLDTNLESHIGLIHPEELTKIDFEYIGEQISKSDEKIASGDYDGAITNARTLLENICYYILENSGSEYKFDGDLPKLYKETIRVLDLGANSHSKEIFKQIISGCTIIVFGLSRVRNVLSDAHGKPSKNYLKPTKSQAVLIVEISKAVSEFLYAIYREKDSKNALG